MMKNKFLTTTIPSSSSSSSSSPTANSTTSNNKNQMTRMEDDEEQEESVVMLQPPLLLRKHCIKVLLFLMVVLNLFLFLSSHSYWKRTIIRSTSSSSTSPSNNAGSDKKIGTFIRTMGSWWPNKNHKIRSSSSASTTTSATTTTTTNTARRPPNVLIILADDVGTGDIPVYWNNTSGLVHMPNIVQKLGEKGVTFLDAHASPLCGPSRYMLLSGNYPHRGHQLFGTWGIHTDHNQFLNHQQSIAQVLREGGNYSTAMFGKWHLGGKVPLAANGTLKMKYVLSYRGHDWSRPLIEGPQDIGFTRSLITPNGIQDAPYSFLRDGYVTTNASDAIWWKRGKYVKPLGQSMIQRNGEGDPAWDSTAYNMILVNETEKFLDDHLLHNAHNPFFAYVALGAVHGPHSPPKYYMDGTPIAQSYPSTHMDMLHEMDKAVGSIVDMIDEKGLGEDTLIIFASDNGGVKPGKRDSSKYGHNSHGPLRGHKGTLYEGGHRIPLIIRWNGHVPENEVRTNLVSIADLYATLCDLAGVSKPLRSAQDSISFAKYLLAGNQTVGLRNMYGAWLGMEESLRYENWKVIRRHDEVSHSSTVEVYDLNNDLSERENLSQRMNEKRLKKMLKKLSKIGPCPEKDRKRNFALETATGRMNVACNFFQQDPSRCELHNEGEVFCPSVCGRYGDYCFRYKGQ